MPTDPARAGRYSAQAGRELAVRALPSARLRAVLKTA